MFTGMNRRDTQIECQAGRPGNHIQNGITAKLFTRSVSQVEFEKVVMLYITPRFPHTHILKMLNAFLFTCFAGVGTVADAIDVHFNQQLRKRKFLQFFSFVSQCLLIADRIGKRAESNLAKIS